MNQASFSQASGVSIATRKQVSVSACVCVRGTSSYPIHNDQAVWMTYYPKGAGAGVSSLNCAFI